MLFRPSSLQDCDPLTIDAREAQCFVVPKADLSFAYRPISEILHNFGDILPIPPGLGDYAFQQQPSPERLSNVLHVASLNAATLKMVGKIKIEWTDTISAHLEFEPATCVIRLFRFPTLCSLHVHGNSILSHVFESYYADIRKPNNFTAANLMREILLSYKLLFRFDSNAERIYRHEERKMAGAGGCMDTLLDDLCQENGGKSAPRWTTRYKAPVKESFDASSDFPILSPRLMRIQEYIDGIQPNRISSLWRDKRDILRWYTFWAVVILGGGNFLVALVQAGLSAAQVNIAQKGLDSQLMQKRTSSKTFIGPR